jgi:hypothetical protein
MKPELFFLRLYITLLLKILEELEKREARRERKSMLGLARVSTNMGKY